MARKLSALLSLLPFVIVGLASCHNSRLAQNPDDGSGPATTPTSIDYLDADAFAAVFEAALVKQAPAIIVRTGHTKPDWSGRLNAWIAAWNRGERSRPRT